MNILRLLCCCLLLASTVSAKPGNSQGNPKTLPPGLQQKIERGGALPPGWEKKLRAGQVLDNDLYRRSEKLPPGLAGKYPEGPAGTELLRLERKIVRIRKDTREILEIFGIETDL